MIACLEEIALHNNWLSAHDLLQLVESYPQSAYSQYLKSVALNEISVL